MTVDNILKIEKVGDLFSNNLEQCKQEYRNLAKQWHPDMSGYDTSDVFKKINDLYNKALELISKGIWEKTNFLQIKLDNNKIININYLYVDVFELGAMYVCDESIIYMLDADKEKYFKQFVKNIGSIKYTNEKMKAEFTRYFPVIKDTYKTIDGKSVLIIRKDEDTFPLKLVHQYFNGKIPDKHVAWIVSRLLNISCFFDYSGIVHNGININNCFVSPKYHTISLLGGWWYTTEVNKSMVGTSKDIFDVMSVSAKSLKISSTITDLESIKLLGRQLLGEKNCRLLLESSLAPKQFIEFLNSGSKNKAYEEMQKWDNALTLAYGKRHFVKLEVTKDQIYLNK